MAAKLAGRGRRAPPRLRRRLRLAGRLLHPARRAHRPRRVDRTGRRAPPTRCSSCSPIPTRRGFFTTGRDAEQLIVRTKEFFDGATPSANAVAAHSLARLGGLTGDARFTAASWRWSISSATCSCDTRPLSRTRCSTADLFTRGLVEVVIAGERPDLLGVVRSRWLPGAVIAWGEPTDSPLWQDRDVGRRVRLPRTGLPSPGRPTRTASRSSSPRCPREREAPPGPHEAARPATSPAASSADRASRCRGGTSLDRPASSPATPRTPPASTSPRARWCECASNGPRTTNPTSRPSTWSRCLWPTSPSATTSPSRRRSPRAGSPATSGPCTGGGSATSSTRLVAPVEEHLLGFPGASAPYWEFRGFRPSLALIVPSKGPVLFRRIGDRSVWARFGWGRSDNWLPGRGPAGRARPRRRTPRPPAGKGPVPPRSASSPTTWWLRSARPATATATRRSGPCWRRS